MAQMNPKMKEIFTEMENLAEDVMTERQQLIDYDVKRQTNREALSVLTKDKSLEGKKVMMWSGSLFVKLPTSTVADIIRKEQQTIEGGITDLQAALKTHTTRLYHLQGEQEKAQGFELKTISPEEAKMLRSK